ncbi:Secretion system C-terminal sorting domain [Flavobacteriaceae bacterium]
MKLKFFILFFFGLAFMSVKAQTMYVRPNAGAQTAYTVANIKKLTFSNGNLVVTNLTGANGTFALSGNRYLNFTDLTLATTTHEVAKSSFYVYPNPVTNVLNITNEDPTQTISHLEIISLEGRVVIAQNTPQVSLAALPQGMYFCKITSKSNQTQTIKFLKQ